MDQAETPIYAILALGPPLDSSWYQVGRDISPQNNIFLTLEQ